MKFLIEVTKTLYTNIKVEAEDHEKAYELAESMGLELLDFNELDPYYAISAVTAPDGENINTEEPEQEAIEE